ncbi:uncharacterized protein RAG0_16590 [Rhynchosporium agropyri]|uniref:DUF7730 domain-containing protein n=1 Tax=Rhynchosporium agropyri TaxID=914238 RepID=A0A1E1LR29_9HELO|nr:uncharacterized protein RAG0_16590 [Rhynchosporium agropyri]
MVFGLRDWLRSLITPEYCGTQTRRDCCDFDLPAPRLLPDRLSITRPSTPGSLAAPELCSAVPCLDHLSATGTSTESLLLELLPHEMRQKIWSLVIGGQTYQLGVLPYRWRSNRLSSSRCLCADPDKCDEGCSRDDHNEMRHVDMYNQPPFKMGDSLCLLTVCRQIYFEAISILYSSNNFVIDHAKAMEFLPLTILPQRMNTIRNLRFIWDFSGPPPVKVYDYIWAKGTRYEEILHIRQEKWQKIWNILSEMTGLRQLYVKLRVGGEWETFSRVSAEVLLGPVKQVTRPVIFLLALPFPAMHQGISPSRLPWGPINGWEGSDPWDDLPNCKIQRITRDEL